MNFSKFDIRMFNEARMEAESSEFKRFHTGAVIVYKKHIIGRGKNDDKSHPMQKEYNRKYVARKQGNRLSVSISKLKKGLKSEWEKTKLQREHDRMIENSLE